MRQFYLLSIVLFSVLISCTKSIAQKKKRPNVLVIYTDDHRYTGIHELGKQAVKTPNMDNLIKNGISFSNTYLQGAFTGATCTPSRAMLLTGRDLFHLEGRGKKIPESHTTMGEAFKKEGYNTHVVGKWDQDKDSFKRSFDTAGKLMGLGPYIVDHYQMPLWDYNTDKELKKPYVLDYDKKGEVFKRDYKKEEFLTGPFGDENKGPHTSELFAEDASKYISNYNKKNPFFMYLAFHAPHDPRQAPKKYVDMYPYQKIELPPSHMQQHPFDNGHIYLRDEKLAVWPRTKEVAQKELAAYYAIITHLDEQIGNVVTTLKKSGQYKNTIIVLAGDSGLAVGNHGLLGKQNVYDEDGLHVPFVISGGAIKEKGRTIDVLSYIHDIFPTVCDLAGISKPKSTLGKSLVPVIKNEIKEIRSYTYHAYLQYQRAFRKGEYKLIEYVRGKDYNWRTKTEEIRGSRVTQLFNIKKDPWETFDLVSFPEYADILAAMKMEMKKAANNYEDKAKSRLSMKYDFWDNYTD